MKVTLYNYTPDPEDTIASAAAICYKSIPHEGIIKHCIKSRHKSVLEFATFDFLIEGISRSASHQFVRKRVGIGFAQESQRYVVYDEGFDFVIPHTIIRKGLTEQFIDSMEYLHNKYNFFISNDIPAEDSRFVLPNAAQTNMRVIMNGSCLIDFGAERLCSRAQWEIREMTTKIKELVTKVAPIIGEHMQPKCFWTKHCPEKHSCGLWKTFLTKEDYKWISEAYWFLTRDDKSIEVNEQQ